MISEKVIISNDAGEKVEAIAPVIISASRAHAFPPLFRRVVFHPLGERVLRLA